MGRANNRNNNRSKLFRKSISHSVADSANKLRRGSGRRLRKFLTASWIVTTFSFFEGCYRKLRDRIRRAFKRFLLHTVYSKRSESVAVARIGIAKRLGRVWSSVGDKVADLSERFIVIRFLRAVFQVVGRRVLVLRDFGCAWLYSRQYWRLLGCIPAVVLMIPFLYFSIRIPLQNVNARATQYRLAAFRALQDGDQERSELYFRRLSQLGQIRPHQTYAQALSKANDGELATAYKMMRQIAPVDSPGFESAHLWIALMLEQDQLAVPADQKTGLQEKHLRHVLTLNPDQLTAAHLLARKLFSTNRSKKATALLNRIPDNALQPPNQISLAKTLAIWRQDAEARMHVKRAIEKLKLIRDQRGDLEIEDYFLWAIAHEMLGQYELAIDVLQSAGAVHRTDEFRSRTEQLCIRFLKIHWARRGTSIEHWEAIAQSILKVAPRSSLIQEHIVGKLGQLGTDQPIRRILQPLIENETVHPEVQMNLADFAATYGDKKLARKDYAQVLRIDPNNLAAMNNLAWLMATTEPLELDSAMQLVNQAMDMTDHDNPSIRETRGQIFMKMSRWSDAVEDLEFAANGLPDYGPVHDSLAVCFEQLGRPALATAHRARAALIRKK